MCSLIKKCIFFTQFRCNQSPLKKFWLWLFVCVHVDSDLSCTPESLIRGVISTAELFQKCVNLTYAHCRLHSVTHTMGVCMTLQFHTHHRVRLNVVSYSSCRVFLRNSFFLIAWCLAHLCIWLQDTPQSFLEIRISWRNRNQPYSKIFSPFWKGSVWKWLMRKIKI